MIVTITKDISLKQPWCTQYRLEGWGDAVAEIYDLKSGEYLALVNSPSMGYQRKVFKTLGRAIAWTETRIEKTRFNKDQESIKIEIVL